MNKINELISKLCKDGVKYKKISEVTSVTIGEFVHKNNQNNNAPYPVYNGGISNTGFYDEYNNDGKNVLISARGANAGFVNKIDGKYWAGNSCYSLKIKNENEMTNDFLYYYLKNNQNVLLGQQQTGSIPAISKKQIEEFKIPIPSVDIQNEIVDFLDRFTMLTDKLILELTTELSSREKQYKYYRDKLFESNDTDLKTLEEVADLVTGATPTTSKKEYWNDGTIPWMSSGEVNNKKIYETNAKITETGYRNTSTTIVPKHTIVMALAGQGKTRGKVAITEIELCTNQSLCSIICKESLDYRYLYYYLDGKYEELRAISNGDGTRGGLSLRILKPYKVPVPTLEEQIKVIRILEKLEKNTNDVIEALSKEIEKRQKQYEYYRNKLLSFKECEVNE